MISRGVMLAYDEAVSWTPKSPHPVRQQRRLEACSVRIGPFADIESDVDVFQLSLVRKTVNKITATTFL